MHPNLQTVPTHSNLQPHAPGLPPPRLQDSRLAGSPPVAGRRSAARWSLQTPHVGHAVSGALPPASPASWCGLSRLPTAYTALAAAPLRAHQEAAVAALRPGSLAALRAYRLAARPPSTEFDAAAFLALLSRACLSRRSTAPASSTTAGSGATLAPEPWSPPRGRTASTSCAPRRRCPPQPSADSARAWPLAPRAPAMGRPTPTRLTAPTAPRAKPPTARTGAPRAQVGAARCGRARGRGHGPWAPEAATPMHPVCKPTRLTCDPMHQPAALCAQPAALCAQPAALCAQSAAPCAQASVNLTVELSINGQHHARTSAGARPTRALVNGAQLKPRHFKTRACPTPNHLSRVHACPCPCTAPGHTFEYYVPESLAVSAVYPRGGPPAGGAAVTQHGLPFSPHPSASTHPPHLSGLGWQCLSSALAPPRGAPGGSVQLGTPWPWRDGPPGTSATASGCARARAAAEPAASAARAHPGDRVGRWIPRPRPRRRPQLQVWCRVARARDARERRGRRRPEPHLRAAAAPGLRGRVRVGGGGAAC